MRWASWLVLTVPTPVFACANEMVEGRSELMALVVAAISVVVTAGIGVAVTGGIGLLAWLWSRPTLP